MPGGLRYLARLEDREEVAVEELHIQSQVGLEEAVVEGEVGTPWCVGVLLSWCVVTELRVESPSLRTTARRDR